MTRAGVADVAGMVDRIAESALAGADELLRADAGLPLPTVHMLCADLEAPYVGYLTSRLPAAGRDSASAVGLLGRLPAVLAATHLVIAWEYASLYAALEPAGGRAGTDGTRGGRGVDDRPRGEVASVPDRVRPSGVGFGRPVPIRGPAAAH